MNKLQKIIPFLFLFFGMSFILGAQTEKGEFIILQSGNKIGTEKYEIKQVGEEIIASGETILSVPQLQLKQKSFLKLDKKLQPIKFSVDAEVNGQPQKAIFNFTEKVIKIQNEVDGQKTTQEIPNQENMVLIANNVFHHINILVRKYDFAQGGKQEFVAVPSVPVEIEYKGEDKFQLKGKDLKFKRLFMTIGAQVAQNVWVDDDKRIIKMSIPLQAADVILKSYEEISLKK